MTAIEKRSYARQVKKWMDDAMMIGSGECVVSLLRGRW